MRKRKGLSAPEGASCAYCEHASPIGKSGVCVCERKGVVRADGSCRHFRFDLLKVKPRPAKLPESEDGLF